MTKIDIISGFLGAGKTTFIKKMIDEAFKGEQIVLIENEFGEVGIDGGFLKDAGIQITEMNSGCICCSLVGDFGKNLNEVITKYHPDRILIEPSGVGKLSDVMKSVIDIEKEQPVKLNALVTVVNALKASKQMKAFGEFFNNQIEYATTVILSRSQNATPEQLEFCVKQIQALNPKASVITTDWDAIKGEQILKTMEGQDNLEMKVLAEARHAQDEAEHHHHHDHDEHEHHHDHGHEDGCGCGHDHHHEPSKPQATRSHTHFEVEFHHVAGHPDHCDCSQCNSYVEYCDVCGESLAKCTCHMPDEDLEKKVYILEGIDCANCAAKIEAKIRQMPEVRDVPVIMVTAKGAEFDKVKGLDLGADDYITKPFESMELIARVRSQLRRYEQILELKNQNTSTKNTGKYIVGDLELDTLTKQAKIQDKPIHLTPKEYQILELLIKHPGQVFSASQIYETIWKEEAINTETIMVHIRKLREKIEVNPKKPVYLKVVWGIGYKIEKV